MMWDVMCGLYFNSCMEFVLVFKFMLLREVFAILVPKDAIVSSNFNLCSKV